MSLDKVNPNEIISKYNKLVKKYNKMKKAYAKKKELIGGGNTDLRLIDQHNFDRNNLQNITISYLLNSMENIQKRIEILDNYGINGSLIHIDESEKNLIDRITNFKETLRYMIILNNESNESITNLMFNKLNNLDSLEYLEIYNLNSLCEVDVSTLNNLRTLIIDNEKFNYSLDFLDLRKSIHLKRLKLANVNIEYIDLDFRYFKNLETLELSHTNDIRLDDLQTLQRLIEKSNEHEYRKRNGHEYGDDREWSPSYNYSEERRTRSDSSDSVEIRNLHILEKLHTLKLDSIPELEYLDVYGLINLKEMVIYNIPLTEINNLHRLENLHTLKLDYIPELEYLDVNGLTNLKEMVIYNTPLTDIYNLHTLKNLEILNLEHVEKFLPETEQRILDLSDLINLIRLRIKNLSLTDLKLSGLAKLEYIVLDSLTHLKYLDVNGLTNLKEIKIYNTPSTEILNIPEKFKYKKIKNGDRAKKSFHYYLKNS